MITWLLLVQFVQYSMQYLRVSNSFLSRGTWALCFSAEGCHTLYTCMTANCQGEKSARFDYVMHVFLVFLTITSAVLMHLYLPHHLCSKRHVVQSCQFCFAENCRKWFCASLKLLSSRPHCYKSCQAFSVGPHIMIWRAGFSPWAVCLTSLTLFYIEPYFMIAFTVLC